MMDKIFEQIESSCQTKTQKKLITKLMKKFSTKSSIELENLFDLVIRLYLSHKYNEVNLIIDELLKIVFFEENYDVWCDTTFAIGYIIADETADLARKKLIHAKLCEVPNYPAKEKFTISDYFPWIMEKKYLIDNQAELASAIKDNDIKMEFYFRCAVLAHAALVKTVDFDQNISLTGEMNKIIMEQQKICEDNKFFKFI